MLFQNEFYWYFTNFDVPWSSVVYSKWRRLENLAKIAVFDAGFYEHMIYFRNFKIHNKFKKQRVLVQKLVQIVQEFQYSH